MMKKPHSVRLGATAACSMRLIEKAQYCGSESQDDRRKAKEIGKRYLIFGDSWFTGRRLCTALMATLGHEYFGAMKTNHSGVPKEEIEKIMQDWPSGSYIVYECEEIGLFYVGYKYSWKRKGKYFVSLNTIFVVSKKYFNTNCLPPFTLLRISLSFHWDLGLRVNNSRRAVQGQVAR